MSFNLRNRSLLTVQDFTQREFHYLLDLARDLKRAKYARTEQEHLKGKEIVSDLRENFDTNALRLRGRLPRSGCARHLSRSRRVPDRSQGIGQGHRSGPGPDVRRHRIPGLFAGSRRRPGEICRRAGVQRPDRRVPPDADGRRCHDHARVFGQAVARNKIRLYRRYTIEYGAFPDDRRMPPRHGRPHLRAEVPVAVGFLCQDRPRS